MVCAICLEVCQDAAFPDGCYHQFCYRCILKWSEAMINAASRREVDRGTFVCCPLCKRRYRSLIHNVERMGNMSVYSRHDLFGENREGFRLTPEQIMRRRVYGTGEEVGESEELLVVGNDCGKYLWEWLKRELQALMIEEDVDLVAHLVKSTVERLGGGVDRNKRKLVSLSEMARKKDFDGQVIADVVKPYLFEHSVRFSTELRKYLASGLTVAAYDSLVFQNPEDEQDELDP